MQSTIADDGIDSNIKLNSKVKSVSWCSKARTWTTSVDRSGSSEPEVLRSRFVMLATGYYDYDRGLQASIPGIGDFGGDVVHPQFWPEGLDYEDKNVVIVGSGATAITLLPAMTQKAKHVTMLQRSPSYIMSVPVEDRFERFVRAALPGWLASRLIRLKWIVGPSIFRTYCIWFPKAARRFMEKITRAELLDGETLDPNHTPTYNPFEQRMCMCPNGDFYQCLRDGKGSIKTGTIEKVSHGGIKLSSGDELKPDLIVTATGLKLQLGGGIEIFVDGKRTQLDEHYVWRGLMFEGLPNLAFSFGYLDASWTLGVDTSAQLACRLLKQMKRNGVAAIVPRRTNKDREKMKDVRFMPLTSTYVEKALSVLPKLGDRGPWRPRSPYLWEMFSVKFGDIRTGMEWIY